MIAMYQFLSGAMMFGTWAGGVYFLRFWSKTRDRLFLLFGVSFWLMGLERAVLAFMGEPASEDHSMVYLIRLAAFVVILYAIIDKNKKDKKGAG